MVDHSIEWQLYNRDFRKIINLDNYETELVAQGNLFNLSCKSGQITELQIMPEKVILTYRCVKKLIKPGAALHAYSQGLIDNYSIFKDMLSDSRPKRLFEYV